MASRGRGRRDSPQGTCHAPPVFDQPLAFDQRAFIEAVGIVVVTIASQTRPYEDLRLKTKFDLVNAISHIWKKGKEGERLHIQVERRREGFVISSPCNQGTS